MGRQRTQSQEQVGELLKTARQSLGLSMAFLTRMDGTTQHLAVVESSIPLIMKEGATQDQRTSLCQLILDKKLPVVIPDLRRFPEAMKSPTARFPRIRSYVSVPVVLSDGTLYGTFCAAGLTADRDLQQRDKALIEVLARAAALIIEPGVREDIRQEEILSRLVPLLETGGPSVVFQPIIDLTSGARVGVEALSRFPAHWDIPPNIAFEQAHSVGFGAELELLALQNAAQALDSTSGYVGMNISPAVLMQPASSDFLQQLPLARVVLELSEHQKVDDYPALCQVLRPLRDEGMRLAIDDVGAGFSSLRHIILTSPDVVKLDISIVSGIDSDHVLSTLARSLVQFSQDSGALTVAEGVETADEARALKGVGIDHGQGWHFGRPVSMEQLTDQR